jgi:hypothetical protein
MSKELTPDGLIVIAILTVAVLVGFLWILIKARMNDGIAEIPAFLLLGWDGAAWGPNIIVINKDYWNKKPLIAHEKCHQDQQRRDGWITFYFRYFTSKEWRFKYELEAYRVWLKVEPDDVHRITGVMVNSYGFNLTYEEAYKALTAP